MFTVLLADDERILLEGIAAVIEWERFETALIGKALNGRQAYEMIAAQLPHIVITDVKMPEMDGIELVGKVRETCPDTCFILLYERDEFDYVRHAAPLGVKHYLPKPCNERSIQLALNEVVSELKMSGEPRRSKAPGSLSRGESAPRVQSEMIREVIRYVGEHLHDETLTLSRLAREVFYMNADYLGRLFRNETGIKFSEYVMHARINEAINWIHYSPSVKIVDLAEKVGFCNNPQYFSQAFKKLTGTTPKQYTRQSVQHHDIATLRYTIQM